MTIAEVIRTVDDIKPNAFSPETKTLWLNEVEGKVQTEVFLWAIQEIIVYDYAVDADTELLVSPPHDKIYAEYLTAKIDYANGEYDKYANTMQTFNAFWSEFVAWFATRYRPADIRDTYLARRRLKPPCLCSCDEETIAKLRQLAVFITTAARAAETKANDATESAAVSKAAADAVITVLSQLDTGIDFSSLLEFGGDLRSELDELRTLFNALLSAVEEVA